jgi:hypothetical protein
VNQDSSGPSTANATQNETQCEDAATSGLMDCSPTPDSPNISGGLTQKQYGPVGVGKVRHLHRGRQPFQRGKGLGPSIQTGGNPGNRFTISQTSTQNADTGATQQNVGQADCDSGNGSCTAGQTATLNGQDINDGYTAPSITGSNTLIIKCTNGHASCTATPPPTPTITVSSEPSNPSESRNASFEWTDPATAGVTYNCSIDGGDTFTDCDSDTGTSYSDLPLGSNTFEVTVSDQHGNTSDPASFTWTIVPYLTFEQFGTGSSAGWTGNVPGSSITLVVGTDPESYGQFTLHNFEGIAIGDLPAEPTFTTDVYHGAPRYEIDLDDGHYLFGYPPEAGFGSNSWDVNCGDDLGCTPMPFVTWDDVKAAEGSATVTDVLIEADSNAGDTYHISNFSFDDYVLNDFTNHFH